jgi:hypothetical protein
MKITSKEKIQLAGTYYFEYLFDTGHKYRVWDNDLLVAYTPTGRYPSKVKKQSMERIISEWEDRRIQFN